MNKAYHFRTTTTSNERMVPTRAPPTKDRPSLKFTAKTKPSTQVLQPTPIKPNPGSQNKQGPEQKVDYKNYEQDLNEIENLLFKYDEYRFEQQAKKQDGLKKDEEGISHAKPVPLKEKVKPKVSPKPKRDTSSKLPASQLSPPKTIGKAETTKNDEVQSKSVTLKPASKLDQNRLTKKYEISPSRIANSNKVTMKQPSSNPSKISPPKPKPRSNPVPLTGLKKTNITNTKDAVAAMSQYKQRAEEQAASSKMQKQEKTIAKKEKVEPAHTIGLKKRPLLVRQNTASSLRTPNYVSSAQSALSKPAASSKWAHVQSYIPKMSKTTKVVKDSDSVSTTSQLSRTGSTRSAKSKAGMISPVKVSPAKSSVSPSVLPIKTTSPAKASTSRGSLGSVTKPNKTAEVKGSKNPSMIAPLPSRSIKSPVKTDGVPQKQVSPSAQTKEHSSNRTASEMYPKAGKNTANSNNDALKLVSSISKSPAVAAKTALRSENQSDKPNSKFPNNPKAQKTVDGPAKTSTRYSASQKALTELTTSSPPKLKLTTISPPKAKLTTISPPKFKLTTITPPEAKLKSIPPPEMKHKSSNKPTLLPKPKKRSPTKNVSPASSRTRSKINTTMPASAEKVNNLSTKAISKAK